MKKQKVKILLHHDVYEELETGHKHRTRPWFSRLFYSIANSLATLAYGTGVILVAVIKSPYSLFVVATNKQPETLKDFTKRITSFAIVLLLVTGPFLLASTVSDGFKLGGKVLGASDGAINDITLAQQAISDKNYALAQNKFLDALNKLQSIQKELDQSSALIQAGSKLAPASVNSENLLSAAKLLTEAGLNASKFLEQLEGLSFTAEGLTPKNGSSSEDAVKLLASEGQAINEKIQQADDLLVPINTSLLPAEYQVVIEQVKTLVAELNTQAQPIKELSELLTSLVLGKKTFLVILQNNNELRPTGGFIGTIARGKIDNGVISTLDIRTVYDIDGQLSEWITPPSPLRAVNNRLFMRDANWFVDFPTSAQRIAAIYEKSGGETPDLIFAFTPDLFVEFLKQTGPIQLPAHDTTVSAENFIEQTQTSTSLNYNKDLNQPKQMLADLYPVLMQRLGEVSKDQPLLLFQLLQQQLAKKNILAYSRLPELQNRFHDYRWSGEVSETNNDYLYINSANLNGSKTDRAQERSAQLTTTINADGRIINELQYKIKNPLPNLEGLTNKSWVRFLVPKGSTLLGASNFSSYDLPNLPSDQTYSISEEIKAWENTLTADFSKHITTGSESGKTFFAGWIEVKPGTESSVSLTYELPYKLGKTSVYSILWEKQPGVQQLESVQIIKTGSRDVVWISPNINTITRSGSETSWQIDLVTDFFAGLILRQ